MTGDDAMPRETVVEDGDPTAREGRTTRAGRALSTLRRSAGGPWRAATGWADRSTRRTRRRTVGVLLVLLVVVGSAGATLAALRHSAGDQAADVAAATAAGQQRAAAVLTFRADSLDADIVAARGATTGSFADQYQRLTAQVISTVGRRSGTSVTTRFDRTSVVATSRNGVGDRVVTLLLFGRQEVAGPAFPGGRPSPIQAEVVMTEVGEQWLVAALTPR